MSYERGLSLLQAISSGSNLPAVTNAPQNYVLEAPGAGNFCDPIKPTITNMIDPNNLTQSNPDVVEFNYANTSGFTKRILIGCGLVGAVAAFATKYAGIFPAADALGPAIGSAGVTDQFGSNCPKTQFFNYNAAGHNVILKSVKVKASAAQIAQPITLVSIDLNGNSYPIVQEFTQVNTQLNYAILENCPISASNYQGFYYDILNNETLTLSLVIAGWGIVQGTAPKLMH